MHMSAKLSASCLVICGALLGASSALAQGSAGISARPGADANTDFSQPQTPGAENTATAIPQAAPVVNPPDPVNPGTLAESARTTAIASYPRSTADTWFGTR
jgi:hypothetical protein